MPSIFDNLIPIQDKNSLEEILNNMLNSDNVEMKTQIQKPTNLTKLAILAQWLESEGMIETAKMINRYIFEFRINMVSFNRQSRKEIIAALTPNIQAERNLIEKLTEVKEKK